MKKKICVVALAAAVMFTGCGSGVSELSRSNNDIAAQYVADKLLKHNKNYEEGLEYDHSLLRPTPIPVATPKPVKEGKSSNDGKQDNSTTGGSSGQDVALTAATISEVYGVKGIAVTPISYQLKNSYGSSVYQVMPRGRGNKLAVVYFNISNKTSQTKRVNFAKKDVSIELLVNGSSVGSPLLALMDNDLQNWNASIGAGAKKQGILLFEVDKSMKVGDVKVRFQSGKKEAVTTVK